MKAIIKFVLMGFVAVAATKGLYAVTVSVINTASLEDVMTDTSIPSAGIEIITKSIPLGDKW